MSITPTQLAHMLEYPGTYGFLCATDRGDNQPFFAHQPHGHVLAEVRPAHRAAMLHRAHLA